MTATVGQMFRGAYELWGAIDAAAVGSLIPLTTTLDVVEPSSSPLSS
jgi:hypothetical protein